MANVARGYDCVFCMDLATDFIEFKSKCINCASEPHVICVARWIRGGGSCPNCRQRINMDAWFDDLIKIEISFTERKLNAMFYGNNTEHAALTEAEAAFWRVVG